MALGSIKIYNKDTTLETVSGSSIILPICGQNNSLVTLYGYKDSAAEAHAKKWNYKFQEIGDSPKVETNKLKVVLEPKEELRLSVDDGLMENKKMT